MVSIITDEIDWFAPSGTAIRASYDLLEKAASEFSSKQKNYTHRVMSGDALTRHVETYVGKNSEGKYYAKDSLSPEQIITGKRCLLHDLCAAPFYVDYLVARSNLAVNSCLAAALVSLRAGSVIPAYSDLRAVIEHVGYATAALRTEKVVIDHTKDVRSVRSQLNHVRSYLHSKTYGTRLNWAEIFEGKKPLRQMKSDNLAYKVEDELKVNLQTSSIMSSVDKLGKEIEGLRTIYEVLCDFTHPNLGANIACSVEASRENEPDINGIPWVTFTLGPSYPLEFAKIMQNANVDILNCITACVQEQTKLNEESIALHLNIQKAAQIVLRDEIRKIKDLFGPYTKCPCRSGKNTRFCCGKNE